MKPNIVIIGVIIAVGIVGVVWGVSYFAGGPRQSGDFACGYDDCDWTGTITVKVGQPYPPQCPKCGRQSALKTSTCPNCGHRQIQNALLRDVISGKEDLPTETICTQCGTAIPH
jgi:hypothetical protein